MINWKWGMDEFNLPLDYLKKISIKKEMHRKLWIWSRLLQKSLMENFIFCAVSQ